MVPLVVVTNGIKIAVCHIFPKMSLETRLLPPANAGSGRFIEKPEISLSLLMGFCFLFLKLHANEYSTPWTIVDDGEDI